jgi:hypothetical protein
MCGQTTHNKQGAPISHMHKHVPIHMPTAFLQYIYINLKFTRHSYTGGSLVGNIRYITVWVKAAQPRCHLIAVKYLSRNPPAVMLAHVS